MKNESFSVCLVDDDSIYQFIAKKTLETIDKVSGISVFSNGEQAIKHLEQNGLSSKTLPDVILLDINMPVMNGWEFLTAYDSLQATLAKPAVIIMVSSSLDDSDMKRAQQFSTVKSFLNKPVTKEKLEEVLCSTSIFANE